MPITKITIENFKGIGERVEVDLKPITILFGANSAGKSTLLQAMLYLRELLERRNVDADRLLSSGASIDLGGFRQFVHRHDLDREVKIGVTVEVSGDGLPVLPVVEMRQFETEAMRDFAENGITGIKTVGVEVTVGWNGTDHRPEIRTYSVSLDGEPFAKLKAESAQQSYLVECELSNSTIQRELQIEVDPEDSSQESFYLEAYLERENLLELAERLPRWDPVEEAGHFPESYRIPIESRSVIPDWNTLILPNPFASSSSTADDDSDDGDEFQTYAFSQLVLSQLLVGAGKVVLEELQKIRYVGPIRTIPDRGFAGIRSPSGDRWAGGMAAWDLLHQSAGSSDENGLVKTVSDWLSAPERLNMGYSLSPAHLYKIERGGFAMTALRLLANGAEDEDVEERVRQILKDISECPESIRLQLRDLEKQTLVAPNDIGVGVSQVVPVIVAALHAEASLVSIEQPELHLHPAVQARLGDLFIEGVLKEGSGNRFILESHSEHVMLRLLRRIRECDEQDDEYPVHLPKIGPEDVSVYYIQSRETQTSVVKLRVSKDGDFLDRWPNGFFDERAEELF